MSPASWKARSSGSAATAARSSGVKRSVEAGNKTSQPTYANSRKTVARDRNVAPPPPPVGGLAVEFRLT